MLMILIYVVFASIAQGLKLIAVSFVLLNALNLLGNQCKDYKEDQLQIHFNWAHVN
jgi:hypothetical protein